MNVVVYEMNEGYGMLIEDIDTLDGIKKDFFPRTIKEVVQMKKKSKNI